MSGELPDEPDIDWDYDPDVEEARLLAELDRQACADPEHDYFSKANPKMPKQAVGEYVAEQGFPVPLIRSDEEWQQAFDDNRAMIRSETYQDYAGYSGLFASEVVGVDVYPTQWATGYNSTPGFKAKLKDLVNDGLRSGELPVDEYMQHFLWPYFTDSIQEQINRFHIDFGLPWNPYASRWRYVDGTNIRVFRDTSVEGRYHLGIRPDDGYVMGYMVDGGDHDRVIEPEGAVLAVKVKEVIEFYEAIRTLPRFDQRQAPLMELKLGDDGVLYFLQYLKTGRIISPVDEFPLPEGEGIVTTDHVRGATAPEGEDVRLYIAPKKVLKDMNAQGIFIEGNRMEGFSEQHLSMLGRIVVHESYLSLKNNHFNSAPLYRPEVALGLWSQACAAEHRKAFERLVKLVHGETVHDKVPDQAIYLDAHITANGRGGTIETDWQPHRVDYQ